MNENTINNDVTMVGEAGRPLLVSRYRIIKQLGAGGMGSVWLAEDTQLDGKLFAIKMLPSILVANKRAYNQLKSEALVSMKLVHPNIVQIRAFEENNGNPFLVMDYIRGKSLDRCLVDWGNLNSDEVSSFLKPIAEALDYAHSKGVVHRDVKPSNIIVAEDGTPYVLDFGIAREIQETMTFVTGKMSSGTLMYMSPEQLHGHAPKKFQDIYSFAAMVYECLAGRPPFCRGQIEYQIDHDDPEPLPNDIAIASSVMAGLAKKPEDRPNTCADVLKVNFNAFQSSGKNREGERPCEPQVEGAVFSALRGKSFAKIAAISLLALGLVGGVWYWQEEKAKEEARIAAEQKEEAAAGRNAETRRIVAEKEKADSERKQKEEAERRLWEGERPREPQDLVSEDASKTQNERQQAVAKLAKLRTQITIKIDDAKGRMEKVADYRGEADGFQKHLNSIDEKWRIVETADRTPSNDGDAEKVLQSLTEADSVIAQELEWLKNNKSARDGAKAIEREIAGSLERELNLFKASDYARSTYNDGMRRRKEGNAALNSGDFPTAHKKLTAAKEKLSFALNEAKAFCIKTHLDSAELFLKSSKWQMCVDKVDKVLEWDTNNTKAIELKNEALNHLVPSLKVIATIDGEEVRGAKLYDGLKDRILPTIWKLEQGKKYGPYNVVYERGGKSYEGTFDAMTADWHGLKLQRVALKEEAQDKVQLWKGGPYWAKKNIGAEKPEDYGYYFWWGDTVGYKREGDKWVASDGSNSNFEFEKLNIPTYGEIVSDLESKGWITACGDLSPQHDAAQKHWGGDWRMPTKMELEDLTSKCDWSWTKKNGVAGQLVRGKGEYSSKSIFLPSAGFGVGTLLNCDGLNGGYWSSDPLLYSKEAWYLAFQWSSPYVGGSDRDVGKSVRPVQGFTK